MFVLIHFRSGPNTQNKQTHIPIPTPADVCIHMYLYLPVYIKIHLYVYIYVYIHVSTYLRVCICMYIQPFFLWFNFKYREIECSPIRLFSRVTVNI